MSADGQGMGRNGAAGAGPSLRDLPPIQRLLESPSVAHLLQRHARDRVVEALRAAVAGARAEVVRGAPVPSDEALALAAAGHLADASRALTVVINATGVVLHTNLGRAPLPAAAVEAMAAAAGGYADLEFDLATGRRGARGGGVERRLTRLTGAAGALAVNNAAAALLLALSGLASGGEVIVSRGEMIEIGGGFRIPDVIAQGGARLVEVGTTNKTRLADYAAAIGERTRVILKVHRSNFRLVGFTAEPSLEALADLSRRAGLTLIHDLGSGALIDLARLGRPSEPTPAASIAAGADLVAFSGDKLMGGPQAGLLVGAAAPIAALAVYPLMRALRLPKTTLAALDATLALYETPDPQAYIPVLRALAQGEEDVAARAQSLRARLHARLPADLAAHVALAPSRAAAGGGTLPGETFASWSLVVDAGRAPGRLAARLRAGAPPVIGRIAQDRLWLDLFTVPEADLEPLADALVAALTGA